jgi:hypothetical protein
MFYIMDKVLCNISESCHNCTGVHTCFLESTKTIVAIVFVAGPQRNKDQHNHLLAFCDAASFAITLTNLLLLMPKIMIDLLKRGIRCYLDFQLKWPE